MMRLPNLRNITSCTATTTTTTTPATISIMRRPIRKDSITRSLADNISSHRRRGGGGHHHHLSVKEIEVVKQPEQQDNGYNSNNNDRTAQTYETTSTAGFSSTARNNNATVNDDYDNDNMMIDNSEELLGCCSTNFSLPGLTEDRVRAFLVDYYADFNSIAPQKVRECWKSFYSRHYTPTYRKIRSSGNAIDSEGLMDMYLSNDLQLREMTLVSVDSIQIVAGGMVAVAVYTADQRFEYKGIYNHDQTVYSVVIEEIAGEPKIVHEQRTTGVPVTNASRWEHTVGASVADSTSSMLVCSNSSNSLNNKAAGAGATTSSRPSSSSGNLVAIAAADPLSSSSRSRDSSSKRSESATTDAPRPPPHQIMDSQSDIDFDPNEEEEEDHYYNESEADDDDDDDVVLTNQLLQRPAFEDSCRGPVIEAAISPPARRKSSTITPFGCRKRL